MYKVGIAGEDYADLSTDEAWLGSFLFTLSGCPGLEGWGGGDVAGVAEELICGAFEEFGVGLIVAGVGEGEDMDVVGSGVFEEGAQLVSGEAISV